ncbi:MAG: hypothetical protein OXI91_08595 [Chloroflexota bacterium]|nr:hypothetical protein [Chloroflexota bacterium]
MLRLPDRLDFRGRRWRPWPALGAAVLFLAIACAAAAPEPTPAPIPTPAPPTSTAVTASESGPTPAEAAPRGNPMVSEEAITPILATTLLNPGEQRVSFLLAGERAIIKAPEAAVTATYLGEGATDAQEANATYHDWPYGIRGAYSTAMTFDRAGPWQLQVSVDDGEVAGSALIDLEVVEESPVPAIGEAPPRSETKTLDKVEAVEFLTTDYNADEDLYRLSVAEAIKNPRPAVVVFASPTFCTSPTCGPQVDTVKELKAAFQNQADFVHVEIYDEPQEIQGDLSRATVVAAVEEWGFTALPHWLNESWVFIINGEGIVEQRFEGYVTLTELEASLQSVLDKG